MTSRENDLYERVAICQWKLYIRKGNLFCQNWYIKGKRSDSGAKPLRIKFFWYPPSPGSLERGSDLTECGFETNFTLFLISPTLSILQVLFI